MLYFRRPIILFFILLLRILMTFGC